MKERIYPAGNYTFRLGTGPVILEGKFTLTAPTPYHSIHAQVTRTMNAYLPDADCGIEDLTLMREE